MVAGSKTIYAVDPGTTHSALCVIEFGKIVSKEFSPNEDMLYELKDKAWEHRVLAVEWIEGMGMAVGKETFETCYWVGRFVQAWGDTQILRVPRRAVKLHLCGSVRAKDSNIRQALIDKLGPQGTKKSPGPTYGVSSHIWAALAVAVTAEAKLKGVVDLEAVTWNK